MCNKAGDDALFHEENIMIDSKKQYSRRSSSEEVSFSKSITLLVHGSFLPEWPMLPLALSLQHVSLLCNSDGRLQVWFKCLLECFQREI